MKPFNDSIIVLLICSCFINCILQSESAGRRNVHHHPTCITQVSDSRPAVGKACLHHWHHAGTILLRLADQTSHTYQAGVSSKSGMRLQASGEKPQASNSASHATTTSLTTLGTCQVSKLFIVTLHIRFDSEKRKHVCPGYRLSGVKIHVPDHDNPDSIFQSLNESIICT